MHAWPSIDPPDVSDLASAVADVAVRVHDTASDSLMELTPADGTARLYVCGITPYDATHLGHAATYVAFDLLNRAWRTAGHRVQYVQNVTDVDDPLLERATRDGEDWRELAQRQTDLFRTDMEALNVLAPAAYIGVVESIPLVVEMIEELRAAGSVYAVEDDLYFSVSADPTFGEVSGWTREQMAAIFAERGGDPDRPGKKDPLDCLLWRAERPDEPAWDSSLGRGRPGWHTECSAIARAHAGGPLDVQGGGSDLVFPHHEMSAAQTQVVANGERFARAYVHTGMVALDGEKMSKSLGNLEFVSRLRTAGVEPVAIRLALLSQHYRSDWEWSSDLLRAAETRLATWREAAASRPDGDAGPVCGEVLTALRADLDAPRALAALDAWAVSGSGGGDAVRRLVDAALGVRL
ncbi:cysteine--1-D-myo-inosityl 2-amino-2-deoxy-alpha-D-glucopyranoside ligase [Nocardioides massiliensis]|uniref:L-cysteine:1D-myo-inositol 2-amino-2-deoxy-alpha-D-glucopyranoside ligase n=1 Tax=Nocardioides massiliensis TaxID=1325935 RepID=A0ABT9NS76_9ACTN|nr:cysteine--1-D-myo-inosityl 2-amino-2-deoxy-alpha-D-glucopyranoside ligase [Nocardioides massiliensis]MDP9823034.1 L-cysteine:1D-myo-inositol 2-amino-2-deoxy-alpha-D-glucopyranoside ligase [Nocardioides massiliensis]